MLMLMMLHRVEKYGRVFKTHLFGYPGYVLTDFAAIETIYTSVHKTTEQFQPDSFKQVELNGDLKLTWLLARSKLLRQ